jgi:hypothetical protein
MTTLLPLFNVELLLRLRAYMYNNQDWVSLCRVCKHTYNLYLEARKQITQDYHLFSLDCMYSDVG